MTIYVIFHSPTLLPNSMHLNTLLSHVIYKWMAIEASRLTLGFRYRSIRHNLGYIFNICRNPNYSRRRLDGHQHYAHKT